MWAMQLGVAHPQCMAPLLPPTHPPPPTAYIKSVLCPSLAPRPGGGDSTGPGTPTLRTPTGDAGALPPGVTRMARHHRHSSSFGATMRADVEYMRELDMVGAAGGGVGRDGGAIALAAMAAHPAAHGSMLLPPPPPPRTHTHTHTQVLETRGVLDSLDAVAACPLMQQHAAQYEPFLQDAPLLLSAATAADEFGRRLAAALFAGDRHLLAWA